MLNVEQIERNYQTFVGVFCKYFNIPQTHQFFEKYGELIKEAPYNTSEKFGGCYRGGMLDVLFTHTVPLIKSHENIITNNLGLDIENVYKTFLILNLSKSTMFQETSEAWKKKNGTMYDFTDSIEKMRLGTSSLYMLQEFGISVPPIVFSSIIDIDLRSEDRKDVNCFSTFISYITSITNQKIKNT